MRDPAVEEIKDRISIVQLIQEYLPLKKAGTSWKGLCPFHNEKSPSFMVSEERRNFHCFGCHEGGDIFAFLMKMEGYDFPEALKLLAERAGVEIAKRDPRIAHERNALSEINDLASRYYRKVLVESPSAQGARDYVAKRGLLPETVAGFAIGFAPEGWESLVTFLRKKGYRDEDIVSSGLALRSSSGRGIYDRFRKRLMFTIRDAQGRAVGFTGRLLPEDEKKPDAGGKYMNTPETALYHKGTVLFGLDQARHEIKKKDLAVVVEGNMDVISSHQAGIKNVVASSGTALTDDQLRLLGRYSQRLAVSFDADAAGENAARKGIAAALRNGFLVRVVTIPEGSGKDPDDCVRKDPALWQKAIADSRDIIDFLVDSARTKFDLNSVSGKKEAVGQIAPIISEVADPIAAAHYVKVLSEAAGLPEDVVKSQISTKPSASPVPGRAETRGTNPAAGSQPKTRARRLGERLLAIFLRFPEVRETASGLLKTDHLEGDDLKALYIHALSAYNKGDKQLPSPGEGPAKELADILPLELDLEPAVSALEETQTILHNLASLHRQAERERLEAEMRAAEKIGDFARINELSKKFKES